jgi:hypothetical protein
MDVMTSKLTDAEIRTEYTILLGKFGRQRTHGKLAAYRILCNLGYTLPHGN